MFVSMFVVSLTPDMFWSAVIYAWVHKLAIAIIAYNHQIAANNVPKGSPDVELGIYRHLPEATGVYSPTGDGEPGNPPQGGSGVPK